MVRFPASGGVSSWRGLFRFESPDATGAGSILIEWPFEAVFEWLKRLAVARGVLFARGLENGLFASADCFDVLRKGFAFSVLRRLPISSPT